MDDSPDNESIAAVRISTRWHCGLHIANGAAVGALAGWASRPMLVERAELLGTTGARLEVGYYAVGITGCGLLVGTFFGLLSLAAFRRGSASKRHGPDSA